MFGAVSSYLFTKILIFISEEITNGVGISGFGRNGRLASGRNPKRGS